jgi:hypothetical protein
MNIDEIICIAKVLSTIPNQQVLKPPTKEEAKKCLDLLKNSTDNRWDWTPEQREYYKLMVEVAKQILEEVRR